MRLVCIALLALVGCDAAESQPPPSPQPPRAAAAPSAAPAEAAQPEVPPESEPEPGESPEAEAEPDPRPLLVVELKPSAGSLKQQLSVYARRGAKRSQRVVLEMGAPWCPPCKRAKALLAEESFAAALGDVVLLRVDSDQWGDDLDALGFDSPVIPAYYRLDDQGGPSGEKVRGDRWKTKAQVREGLLAFLTAS